MIVINARNVNDALATALSEVQRVGTIRSSRNGTVLAFPEPVATVYSRPTERVLFSPVRNANPAFHLMESLWMLAGRNDVKFPATFVKNMKNYSDDGGTFHGAYGHRWRSWFGYDQIELIVAELITNPESRRCVLQMWDATDGDDQVRPDLHWAMNGGKDVPCNTNIYFDRRDGKLNMTVCCRSNDILWGCYGANAVHMSILQEYMALSIGCEVGTYTQMSNDLHIYTATIPEVGLIELVADCLNTNHYSRLPNMFTPFPLWGSGGNRKAFDEDLELFFSAFDSNGIFGSVQEDYQTLWFLQVVRPVLRAWSYRKVEKAALDATDDIVAPDWYQAMRQWIVGRQAGVKA